MQGEVEFKLVETMDEVLRLALTKPMAPVRVESGEFKDKKEETREEGPIAH